MREFDVALRVIAAHKDFEQARTADDIERIRRGGRIACLMGVEGGHMIENSPRGVGACSTRSALATSRSRTGHNIDWADSATDRLEHLGLTDLGRQLVREMNRLGMFADLSHVSADTMRDALRETSRAGDLLAPPMHSRSIRIRATFRTTCWRRCATTAA
jgi:membrane dipeptidase